MKLLKSRFVANVKWREEPGFGMLHHKLPRSMIICKEITAALCFIGN